MTVSPDSPPPSVSGVTPARRTNPWLIVLAVAVVGIPLAWGVSQTVLKSVPLFHHASTTKSATTHPAKGAKGTPTSGPTTHGAKSSKHKK